jgi:peptide/nickel transport system ATP-binding protein
VCEPELLICDEITSALDVSVQAAIVGLLEELQRDEHLSLLFVTHNLALVRTIADRVVVLNRGRIVEAGATSRVIGKPAHPYTRELIADTPTLAALSGEAGPSIGSVGPAPLRGGGGARAQ